MNRFDENLTELKGLIEKLDDEDLPNLGKILNILSDIKIPDAFENKRAAEVLIESSASYVEKLIFFEASDLSPLKDGVQKLFDSFDKNIPITEDDALKIFPSVDEPDIERLPASKSSADFPMEETARNSTENQKDAPPAALSEIDVEILRDFVIESRENLEKIEVSLIELEKDPGNKDTINAIFRPFHTIKGVSGFLNLNKINKLSHSTENLLDGARNGEFAVSDEVVDIILVSIDTLNQLISVVQIGLEQGSMDLEGDFLIDDLVLRIEKLSINLKNKSQVPLGEAKPCDQKSAPPQKSIPQTGIADTGFLPVTDKGFETAPIAVSKKQTVDRLQVKVDTVKLDNLIDQTGELVIAQAMLRQNDIIAELKDQKVMQTLSRLTQIISGLQRTAMSMRMVPIKSTFQKMVRLVRDLARTSKKEVELKMNGEDTEIDRNVVDELYEPLVHMIRNAVDHGLETPEKRREVQKEVKGTIFLRAYHKGGNFVIEIEDDGKGLNKENIFNKAAKNGMIEADARLSESEIFNLIFLPGFSTASKITDVSGRGVGMDVVKKGIEKFRGRLEIQSQFGKGTRFIISLPLTLAIIEGMLVRVGNERYIVPTMSIIESFKPKKEDCYTIEGKGEVISMRGGLIPLMRLYQILGVEGDAIDPWDGLVLVVENKNEKRGLLLDELLGQEEIVIKSLGETLSKIKGLAGGAIMGDGKVGLILDMDGLFEMTR